MLPRVRVDNLASKALSMALRSLAERWEANHACRPVLCETFIDPTRFDGTCHKAANWETIGMTAGKRSGRGCGRDGHSRAGQENPSESGSGDDTRPRDLKPNLAGQGRNRPGKGAPP